MTSIVYGYINVMESKTRTNLVKSLADLKYNQNIKTYWTTDGRVYTKLNESSRRKLIRNHDDIRNLLNASDYDIKLDF
jgi:hypothetical protein